MESAALALLLTSVAWITVKYFVRPLCYFFDLRRQIARRLSLYSGMRTLGTVRLFRLDDPLEMRDPREDDAEGALRDLGTRMLSFGHAASLGGLILRMIKYEPTKAGTGLIDLSNEIQCRGTGRAVQRATVQDALRIRQR
jgi:hypothetical protein